MNAAYFFDGILQGLCSIPGNPLASKSQLPFAESSNRQPGQPKQHKEYNQHTSREQQHQPLITVFFTKHLDYERY
jgi:hypothetical protein